MVFKPTIKSDVLLSEVKIIAPDIYREKRGSIWTSFSSEDYDGLVPQKFNHDKFSISDLDNRQHVSIKPSANS